MLNSFKFSQICPIIFLNWDNKMNLLPASFSCFLDFFQEKKHFFCRNEASSWNCFFFTLLLQKIADKWS